MNECEFYEFDGICSKCLPHELLCSQINGCTYKQLLAEQAKNSELEATLKILKINHKLTMSELNNEQAKNKKLVEALKDIQTECNKGQENIKKSNNYYDGMIYGLGYLQQIKDYIHLFSKYLALNEVNK